MTMPTVTRSEKSKATAALPLVLTLPEAARMLRLEPKQIEELVIRGEIPGRQIGQEYRFFRPALEGWLQGTTTKKTALGLAGGLAGDPYFPGILEDMAKERKRGAARRE
jgi:excisionase family DNA binding protein